MRSSDKHAPGKIRKIDWEGRRAFLSAIERVDWGKRAAPHNALLAQVTPSYDAWITAIFKQSGHGLLKTIRTEIDAPLSALRENPRPEAKAAFAALLRWGDIYGFIENDWILECAHVTARISLKPVFRKTKLALSRVIPAPPSIKLAGWNPDTTPWGVYRSNQFAKLQETLTSYKKLMLASSGSGKATRIATHARWTALHFTGLSLSAIAKAESKKSGSESRRVSRQSVHEAVHSFANRVGLKLPLSGK